MGVGSGFGLLLRAFIMRDRALTNKKECCHNIVGASMDNKLEVIDVEVEDKLGGKAGGIEADEAKEDA